MNSIINPIAPTIPSCGNIILNLPQEELQVGAIGLIKQYIIVSKITDFVPGYIFPFVYFLKSHSKQFSLQSIITKEFHKHTYTHTPHYCTATTHLHTLPAACSYRCSYKHYRYRQCQIALLSGLQGASETRGKKGTDISM